MAILDRKAAESAITLPHKVRIYLATQLKSNVRELEGALTRLMAIASLSRSEITLSMAQQTLRSMVAPEDQQVTIESIQKAVCDEFGLKLIQLCQKTNAAAIARPRQIAMYLCKELIGASFPEIGRAFRGKHHTTVLHAVHRIERLRQRDEDINSLIHKLTDRIN
jgi:chromosomal replication initiator protein